MADTMQFDLVSPERRLASVQAREVQIPGAEGDMTAMPDHAATITTLRPGLLRVVGPDGTQEYLVTGGFAEIGAGGTSVLAEEALPRDEVTQDVIARIAAEIDAAWAHAQGDDLDMANKRKADLSAAAQALGLAGL